MGKDLTVWQGARVPTATPELTKSLSPQQLAEHRQRIVSSPNRCLLIGGLVYIGLTRGFISVVDEEYFDIVRRRKWYSIKCGSKFYACNTIRGRANKSENSTTLLHRLVAECPEGKVVDHINGDTFDNRRSNLRICSTMSNLHGQGVSKNSSTGVRGVRRCGRGLPYVVGLMKDGKNHYGGKFATLDEATEARDGLALILYGEDFKKCLA